MSTLNTAGYFLGFLDVNIVLGLCCSWPTITLGLCCSWPTITLGLCCSWPTITLGLCCSWPTITRRRTGSHVSCVQTHSMLAPSTR